MQLMAMAMFFVVSSLSVSQRRSEVSNGVVVVVEDTGLVEVGEGAEVSVEEGGVSWEWLTLVLSIFKRSEEKAMKNGCLKRELLECGENSKI